MKDTYLKAAYDLAITALRRIAQGDVDDPASYARETLPAIEKWHQKYEAEGGPQRPDPRRTKPL